MLGWLCASVSVSGVCVCVCTLSSSTDKVGHSQDLLHKFAWGIRLSPEPCQRSEGIEAEAVKDAQLCTRKNGPVQGSSSKFSRQSQIETALLSACLWDESDSPPAGVPAGQ